MIAKQIKGRSFSGVLNYLHHKVGAECIGGTMVGETPRQLVGEFRHSTRLNPSLKSPVYHASLSVARSEEQSNEQWQAIAADYVNGMGFRNCQYVVYRHHDQAHDHIHIVASRTQITDGRTVSDSWDYRRSQHLLRELEGKYHLQPVQSSWEKGQRSPTTGESRMMEEKGNVSVRLKLQSILNEAIAPDKTMPDFVAAIQQQGVSVRLSRRTGGISGISYEMDGIAFSGTHLGRDFTFPGLQKHRQLSYEPSRDDEALARALQPQPPESASLGIDPLQKQAAEAIAPIAVALFQEARRSGTVIQADANRWILSGNQYVMSFDQESGVFSLQAQDGRGELLRLRGSDRAEILEVAQRIEKQDLFNFQLIERRLQQQETERDRL